MKLFIVLNQEQNPIENTFFTEDSINKMKALPESHQWRFIPITLPWENIHWDRRGGSGISPYPLNCEKTTIRLPKSIAEEVQQYAVWLSHRKPLS